MHLARWILRCLPFAALLACHAGPEDSGAPSTDGSSPLAIDPRFQWEENYGYCGETAFISAGLYYGQYNSQYDARDYASGGTSQARAESQLLLGGNSRTAAEKMHLRTNEWSGARSSEFLRWVKQNVALGFPVIIGVYTNENRLYGDSAPDAGDSEYDHIVPVVAIGSNHPLTDGAYYADDTLTFSDNGLVGDDTPEGSEYLYTYSFGDFPKTRAEANDPAAPWYSLSKDTALYGVAVNGVVDLDADALPVSVQTSVNYESPEIEDGTSTRPAATDVDLTITVSGLAPGTDYVLYRYDDIDKVPESHFNASSGHATESWPVRIDSGSTWSTTETVASSDVAAYRAVRADAP